MGAVSNCRYFEYPMPMGGYGAGMVDQIELQPDGTVRVPSKPGLGVEVDWERMDAMTVERFCGQAVRVVVIGAGVVGVTTAYYLGKAGHQVTMVEKEPEAATLASAGNAGLIAPGHSFAWASPTAPKELLRSLTVEDTALRINPLKAPGMALWGLKFLRECNAERAAKNTLVKLRLAQYSQRMLDQISADEHIDYDDIHEGLLYLYRDAKRFEAGVKKMKFLQDHGQKQDVLDADGGVGAEPTLAPVEHKLARGSYG